MPNKLVWTPTKLSWVIPENRTVMEISSLVTEIMIDDEKKY